MANPQIALPPEIVTSDKTPRVAIAFDRTSGVKQQASTTKEILIVGQMLAAGTQPVNTPIQLLRETDSEGYFGIGSPIDIAAKAAFLANPNIILSAVGIADAGTKATATITIAGGNATNSGEQWFYIMGRKVVLAMVTGDTPTIQATALAAAINARTDLPVTATSAVGVVTLTAKVGGTICNTITLRSFTPLGFVPGSTYTLSGAFMGTAVAGVGTVSTTNATAACSTHRYHLIVPCFDDQTTEQAMRDYATAEGQAELGAGELVITAQVAALSAHTTQALAVNGLRNTHYSINGSESWFVEIAAAMAGVMASESVATRPYNTLPLPGIKAPPIALRWLRTETRSLIDNGCTPLTAGTDDIVRIMRAVSTNVTNVAGNKDYSVLDITKVQAFDDIRDNATLMLNTNYPRARWADSDPDGLLPTDVATPQKVTGDFLDVLRNAQARGIVQQVEQYKSQIVVNKVGTQMQFSLPANVVDGMHEKLGKVVLISTPFGT
jgi:phage tail sheath gpL-like